MEKVQVFLRGDQKAALKAIGARTGQRQSDLIREGVDLLIERSEQQDADWREVTRAVAGLWRDRADIDDIGRSLRAAAKRRFGSIYDKP
ncbi:MAG: hypothetical protein CMM50_03960 [Rhodospirillaceae bacterium]|nr:hypothetical protein [Rhodospirillaceae bacterium]